MKNLDAPLRCPRSRALVESWTSGHTTATKALTALKLAREVEHLNSDLLDEMRRYLPILQRAESMPTLWVALTEGTGIATVNGYEAAIAKATTPTPHEHGE